MSTSQHHHGKSPAASHQHQPVLVPPSAGNNTSQDAGNAAVDMIRRKLAAIYGEEPNEKKEFVEAQLTGVRHSKHQRFLVSLHESGMTASEIQTAWHQYYVGLDDNEKRQVWQEFYDQSALAKARPAAPAGNHASSQQFTPGSNPATSQPAAPAPVASHHQAAGHDLRLIYPTPTLEILPEQGRRPAATVTAPLTPEPTISPQSLPNQAAAHHQANPATGNPLLPGINTGTVAANTPLLGTSQTTAHIPSQGSALPATEAIRQRVRDTVSRRSTARRKSGWHSIFFGLGVGVFTVIIILFGFFNEVIIAPFIQPSRHVSATPIIMSPDGLTASGKNEVIIPKINVEIPLDFSSKSTDEKDFDAALNSGVAHYPTTSLPGQTGNAAFFGHSSNNIFNPGKFKFAFVLLNELVPGDSFYLTYNGVAYTYTIYDKQVVDPTQVDILNPVDGKKATAVLVTCDPPGTSLRRLVVWGEQVSPNPNSNAVSNAKAITASSSPALPGNSPTLWSRFRTWLSGN